MSDLMKIARVYKPGGKLVIESAPIPNPGPGEVLVKMAASPINPSDLASIDSGYMSGSWPFTPGLEGSGTVVKSGSGIFPSLRMGKRVACSPNPGGDGTWAEYMKTSAMHVTPLPSNINMDQGAMLLINPMTALAFIHMARKEKHKAIVNNAAASALGKILIQLAQAYSIPLISIVRNEARIPELKSLGAPHVLNSSTENFEEELKELVNGLEATLFFDAVTGDETERLLRIAPDGSKLIAYARLSGDPIRVDPAFLIKPGKTIQGFQLGTWLKGKNMAYKLRFISKVKKHLAGSVETHVASRVPLEDVNQAISSYRKNMSDGKILLYHQ